MSSPTPPPYGVLEGFGLLGQPLEHLKGGLTQTVWRAGQVVVKPADDAEETEWACAVLDAMDEDGFRVVKPVRSRHGEWMVDGYTAWHWLEGTHRKDRWSDIVLAARAFHQELPRAAARAGRDTKPTFLDSRDHRWAQAERTVWHGAPLPTKAMYDVPEFALYERIAALSRPMRADEASACQVVHGDITGNVLFDGARGVPAFIDMSPGWRTPASVEAQIVVEAVGWFGADTSVLAEHAALPDGVTEMARVCAWRLLCGFQALTVGLTFDAREVANWTRVIEALGA